MDHPEHESLTGKSIKYGELNSESNSRPSSVNDNTSRFPYPTKDRLSRASFSATDGSPRLHPRQPSSATDLLPRPPSRGSVRSPRPPSPVARDLIPRSRPGSLIRRRIASRPGSCTSSQGISNEGNSKPNSPKLPLESTIMRLGGNTDKLIAFYETIDTKQNVSDIIPKLPSSDGCLNENIVMAGTTTQATQQQCPVPQVTEEEKATIPAKVNLNPDSDSAIGGEIYDEDVEPSVLHATDGIGSGTIRENITDDKPNELGYIEKEAMKSVQYTKDPQQADQISFKDQNTMEAKDQIQTSHGGQSPSPLGSNSLIQVQTKQEADPSNGAKQYDANEYSSTTASDKVKDDTDDVRPVMENEDVSRMANASDALKETWKKLIETNLQTLETLRVQKQASDEIHSSYCMEYERLREEVVRLYEDNGRKRYLVDEIRLKYPDMIDEYDELRPMNEIKDRFIRNREEKVDMEPNVPRLYTQFLKDKLQIERSLGMECVGYPLKAFVDQYNEMKVGKVKEEKQKLNLIEAFPMPDIMTRVDKSKSGKYPVFKIVKDGDHFVMNHNGLIRVMPRHKEMIKEDDRLVGNDATGSIYNKENKFQEHKFNCRDELFCKPLEQMNVDADFENKKTTRGVQSKFKLGAATINFIQKKSLDNHAEMNDQAKRHNAENELRMEFSPEIETRGRKKTKAKENHAKQLKPFEEPKGHGIDGRGQDEGVCGRQLQLTQLIPKGRDKSTSSRNRKHVQTPRRKSSNGKMENLTNKMVLPPVVAHGKDRRMADMNEAMRKNMRAKPREMYTPQKLDSMSRESVGDSECPRPMSKQNFEDMNEVNYSRSRMTQPGYGDFDAAFPLKTPLKADVSSKRNMRATATRDIGVVKSNATRAPVLKTTKEKDTQKAVMRVDNHDYNRKPRPPTSTISLIPERLPAIPKGYMTTAKASHLVDAQTKRQPSAKVRGIGSAKRVDSAGHKNLIDVNDVSSFIQHRKQE